MRAWRLHPGRQFRLDEVELPPLRDSWAEVAVSRFQVSVTEARALEGRPGIEHDAVAALLDAGEPVQAFGHEYCGVVTKLGLGPSSVRVGDRVTSLGKLACGRCGECSRDRQRYCSAGKIVGIHLPGCFAEVIQTPTAGLVRIDDAVPDADAAGLQPVSSCVAAFKPLTPIVAGSTVLVVGLGPMGLGLVQLARLANAEHIIAVGRTRTLDAGRDAGATLTLAMDDEARNRVMCATGGLGVDISIEAAGAVAPAGTALALPTLEFAARVTKPGGTMLVVSTFPEMAQFDPRILGGKSLRCCFRDNADRSDLVEAHRLVSSGAATIAHTHELTGLESLPEALRLTMNKAEAQLVGAVQVVVHV